MCHCNAEYTCATGNQDTGNGGGGWDNVHDNYRQQYGDSYGY